MIKLRKLEKALLAFGLLVMLGSGYAITGGYEHVLSWFNLQGTDSHSKLAEARQVQGFARRKEFLTPEFRPLKERQSVFNNDYIMTGHEGGLLLAFVDGSKIQLDPDTMVQITARGDSIDPEKFRFNIVVEKGKVKGTSSQKSLVTVKPVNSAVMEVLPTQTPEPIPEPVVIATSTPAPTAAAVAEASASPTAAAAASVSDPVVATATPTKIVPASTPDSMEIAIDFDYLKKGEEKSKPKLAEKETALVSGPEIIEGSIPDLKLPQNDAVIALVPHGGLLFTWAFGVEQNPYLFELSTDEHMSSIFYSGKTSLNFVKVKVPKTGVYYWRVTDAKTKLQSEIRKVTLAEPIKP